MDMVGMDIKYYLHMSPILVWFSMAGNHGIIISFNNRIEIDHLLVAIVDSNARQFQWLQLIHPVYTAWNIFAENLVFTFFNVQANSKVRVCK